ncbi:hypothetical protein BV25DRAFT_1902750 [Artomyces pyxidatus]|uniref:Uncharacterized protein n=1 Tax=Artomyces pyxidatus TaxID=48021 RepID=A0ACB8SLG5_9AGAM|nr:hypothetical protein BV25DRAFT_1902750 [Artomyces pyxidatus]
MSMEVDVPQGTVEEFRIVESDALWLQDGNLIIRTTSTSTPPTRTLYKVHKYTLALHCEVFSSLWNGPQTAFEVASEKYNGLPIMDLTDEEEDDWNFLKALYLPKATQVHAPMSNPFREYEYYLGMREEADPEVPDIYPNPTRAIRLAMDFNVPDVVPIAFYDLACAVESASGRFSRTEDLSDLTPEDLRRFIQGRTALWRKFSQFLEASPLRVPICSARKEEEDEEDEDKEEPCKTAMDH